MKAKLINEEDMETKLPILANINEDDVASAIYVDYAQGIATIGKKSTQKYKYYRFFTHQFINHIRKKIWWR